MTDQTSAAPSLKFAIGQIGQYARQQRQGLCVATGLCVLSVAAEMVPFVTIWWVVSELVAGQAGFSVFVTAAGVCFAAIVITYSAKGVALAQSHIAAFDTLRDLRRDLARHLFRLPMGDVRRLRSGEAKTLMISEPERLEMLIAHALPEGVSAIVMWLVVSVWLVWVDPFTAAAAIFPTLLSFALIFRAMGQTAELAPSYQAAAVELDTALAEEFNAVETLRTLPRQPSTRVDQAINGMSDITTQMARGYLPLGSAYYALVSSNLCFVLPIGIWRVQSAGLSLPDLFLFLVLGAHYSLPLLRLFSLMHHMNHAAMSVTRLHQIKTTPEQPQRSTRIDLPDLTLRFDSVSLTYNGRPALTDISFQVCPGEMVALVGPSGAGKTSVASLVPRFSDPDAGRITIGGVDLRDVPPSQLMEHIGFVFQDSVLFSATVAENLRMAKPDATLGDMRNVTGLSQILDRIDALPQGFDTRLGAGGVMLSGGERQRLAIARMLLKDPSIVVLDEPTASLDPENETSVLAALDALLCDRAAITITHRLNTIRQADQILVLDHGRIVQSGTHEDLRSSPGLYAHLLQTHDQRGLT